MSDSDDPQDLAEDLDADEVDPNRQLGYEEPPSDFPPDRFAGVNQYGVTEAEEEVGEPLDERVTRELPDPLVEELDRAADEEERAEQDRRRGS